LATSRRNTSQRLTLLILVIASITAITLDYRGPASHALGSVRNGVRDVFAPIQQGLSDVFRPVGDFFSGAVNYESVVNDNAHLREQIGNLRRQALENQSAAEQLQQLLALEHLPFLGNSKDVLADVISGPSSNFELTLTIDRGTADGVGVGMPVVSGAGLIGTVISAGTTTAVVRLVTDPSSRVGVRFPDGDVGVASGQGAGRDLSVQVIGSASPLPRRGQVVFTSGLQPSAYPAGIPVGTVAAVHFAGGALNPAVAMRPIALLSDVQYVAVVQWLPVP
jgi:rod shape-determining protein MreC